MIHQFNFPTVVRFGEGAVQELGSYLKNRGSQHPLLITDGVVAKLAFFEKIINDLKQQGLSPELFCDISKNPVKSDVTKGNAAYHQHESDAIVGLGGGAAMDVARAIVLSINNTQDLLEYDELIGGDQHITEPMPLFVTVPTTAGTGSEVGRSAIISDDVTRKKHILFHPSLMAQIVFADPELTYDLPPAVTAATGMDALTHNLEAYLAKNYHPMADGIALEGIRMIFRSLEKAVNQPDAESRREMLLASLMGAVAFQKGLGVVHSMAHPLSALLDMHHGLANAICLPYGLQFNIAGFEDRFSAIAQAMNLADHSGEAVIEALVGLNEKIGLPIHLSTEGVTNEHLDELATLASEDFAHPNNPKPVTREDFVKLYTAAL
ncbi:iron-containing alcohol dehydrogenase [Tunicatimonas pelagia]|uniref:iron-containing alcohol dehydrogenase n=1 Tax=Tunicatimonas pelagia TaxID=931531 RepID=UPI00266510E8|nr:iron-containing alcohol dehydrogenase [Tunicatimonas pelagia]WKN45900.1 iron-containing alcohol dehydrogenase [Tunicatimonas pelagia]